MALSQAAAKGESLMGHRDNATTEQDVTNPARDRAKYGDPHKTMKALCWEGKNTVQVCSSNSSLLHDCSSSDSEKWTFPSRSWWKIVTWWSKSLVLLCADLTYTCCTVHTITSIVTKHLLTQIIGTVIQLEKGDILGMSKP